MKARWLASVAAAAGVSALGEAARAASGTGWGLKAAAALAIAAGAVGLYALLPDPEPPAPPVAKVEGSRGVRGAELESEESPPQPMPVPAIATEPPRAGEQQTEGLGTENLVADLVEARRQAAEGPSAAPSPAPPIARAVSLRQPRREPAPPRAETATHEGKAAEEHLAVAELTEVPPSAAQPEPGGEALVEAEAVPAGAPAQAVPPTPTEESSRQLGEEAAMLSQIRSSLRSGAPGRALDLLVQYRTRFAAPLLEMEAAALRVDALCQSGDLEGGRAEAERFQTTWPSSPLVRRVRAACR